LGAAAARITAEDFVTAPEYAGLRLADSSAGQVGGVRLRLVADGGATRLGPCYQQVPLRLLPPFTFDAEPAALVYLLNPTAGLMDGDGHLVEIEAGPGACAVITGQSATRVHPALGSYATQQWRVRAEAGARLVLLPGPTIPFRGCRYYQRVRIDLAEGARLVWGDVWLPGRYSRAEQSEWVAFERIIQDLEVQRDGRLVYRERFDWRGPWDSEAVRWHLGGPHAAGSLFVSGALLPPSRPEAGDRGGRQAAEGAVLALASGDTCVRWCGPPSEVIASVVRTALGEAGRWSGQGPWLLASNHLAPNHWFSAGLTAPADGP
jgi:urease accessory protein